MVMSAAQKAAIMDDFVPCECEKCKSLSTSGEVCKHCKGNQETQSGTFHSSQPQWRRRWAHLVRCGKVPPQRKVELAAFEQEQLERDQAAQQQRTEQMKLKQQREKTRQMELELQIAQLKAPIDGFVTVATQHAVREKEMHALSAKREAEIHTTNGNTIVQLAQTLAHSSNCTPPWVSRQSGQG